MLTAAVTPADTTSKVTWGTDSYWVANVTETGIVYGVSNGTAIITATIDGVTASCTVTVLPPVTSLTLSQNSITLTKGSSVTIGAVAQTSDGSKTALAWESNNKNVAGVSNTGRVTANKTGKATVTVKGFGGKTATLAVKVVDKQVKVNKLNITGAPKTLQVGKTRALNGKTAPASATNVQYKWKSSKPSVLAVDAAGRVTAKKPGTAVITLQAGGKKAQATITVKAAGTLKLGKTKLSLSKGGSATLKATAAPAKGAGKITWSSSDKGVATVSKSGKVKAVGSGTATITAKTADGRQATCKVSVS